MSISVLRLRIIRNDMLLVFGSTFALLASAFIYYKYQRKWLFIMRKALYDVKYNLIGSKAVVSDFLEAKYNRIDLPKKKGKVAIITGGSRGIGAEITRMLLQCDMEVIIACRTPTAGDEMIRRIRKSGVSEGTARVYLLDNSSFASIRKFAEEIKENYVKIDVLVNNAGVMFPPYGETKDHFEQQWGVNYLSHFLLTSLLLPLLNAAGSRGKRARIVNVSSCAHTVGTINFEDINCKEQFITASAYAQSKLAQVVFTKSLQELMDEKGLYIHAYAVHPGVVNTDLFEHTMMKRYCGWILDVFFKTPTQGATPIVYAAVSESIEEKNGIYISNCRETPVNPQVMNESIRKRLFELSLEQVQLTDFFHAL